MEESAFGEVDDDDGPGVWMIEERPPLQVGKIFVDYSERATIGEHLEAPYVALNQAFRGIWVEKTQGRSRVREHRTA